ncbi:hypothetical protein MIND_00111000 [Mycena indigotica]|uniref:Velvet domain-containing protein n=1 Tax=Mycena indigotica TaxID=2126181 RepID=A0A8H6TFV5_9AGAR|nr:uncharacterized protein MIND_00111000 [Mycena indigotica]KAF7315942.1 hypothetical protein MIND_00111000 [Mycena indigotica]
MPTEARPSAKSYKGDTHTTALWAQLNSALQNGAPLVRLLPLNYNSLMPSFGCYERIPVTAHGIIPYVLHATLVDATTHREIECLGDGFTPSMCGTNLSSAILVPTDWDNSESGSAALFAFPDLGVRAVGDRLVRLHFLLFKIHTQGYEICSEQYSPEFKVVSSSFYQGVEAATSLTRALNRAAVRVRLSKTPHRTRHSARRSSWIASPANSTTSPSASESPRSVMPAWVKEEHESTSSASPSPLATPSPPATNQLYFQPVPQRVQTSRIAQWMLLHSQMVGNSNRLCVPDNGCQTE